MAKSKITPLYERLSRDDDKSKAHTVKLFSTNTDEQCRFFY